MVSIKQEIVMLVSVLVTTAGGLLLTEGLRDIIPELIGINAIITGILLFGAGIYFGFIKK